MTRQRRPAQPRSGLLRSETAPADLTLYVRIRLGGGAPSRTGIFFPEGYRIEDRLDLILYLHGHSSSPRDIDAYWNRPHVRLREGVNASGKNVLLVAPTLGTRSEAGRLATGGGDDYLDEVRAAIGQYGPPGFAASVPEIGNVILACHSGGGIVMLRLAQRLRRYANQVRECWGFDCMYNDHSDVEWAQWAGGHPYARLILYYLPHTSTERLSVLTAYEQDRLAHGASGRPGPPQQGGRNHGGRWSRPLWEAGAQYLEPGTDRLLDESLNRVFPRTHCRRKANAANVRVQPSRAVDHSHVPITHWETCLREALFLAAR